MKITVETTIAAPIEDVWKGWTTPDDIKQWKRMGWQAILDRFARHVEKG